jgi:hypothetical protein
MSSLRFFQTLSRCSLFPLPGPISRFPPDDIHDVGWWTCDFAEALRSTSQFQGSCVTVASRARRNASAAYRELGGPGTSARSPSLPWAYGHLPVVRTSGTPPPSARAAQVVVTRDCAIAHPLACSRVLRHYRGSSQDGTHRARAPLRVAAGVGRGVSAEVSCRVATESFRGPTRGRRRRKLPCTRRRIWAGGAPVHMQVRRDEAW